MPHYAGCGSKRWLLFHLYRGGQTEDKSIAVEFLGNSLAPITPIVFVQIKARRHVMRASATGILLLARDSFL